MLLRGRFKEGGWGREVIARAWNGRTDGWIDKCLDGIGAR